MRYGWEPYLHDQSLKRRLSRVTVPTLFLAGADDGLVRDGYYQDFSRLVSGAQLNGIEGCGHYPAIESADAAAAVVSAFLT